MWPSDSATSLGYDLLQLITNCWTKCQPQKEGNSAATKKEKRVLQGYQRARNSIWLPPNTRGDKEENKLVQTREQCILGKP